MPRQRFGLHYVDEAATDPALWSEWVAALAEPLKSAAEMGQKRPLISVAAPFEVRNGIETSRTDELAGLELARVLIGQLTTLADTSGRRIQVLLGGHPCGCVVPGSGADTTLHAKLAEWQSLADAKPPDQAQWERAGWVSLWAGVLPHEDLKKLLHEHYGTDGPVSSFARALQIEFYEHELVEHDHTGEPVALELAVRRLSFISSFIDHLPADARQTPVNAVVVLWNTDFSQRPRNAARNKLRFIGAFPYSKSGAPLVNTPRARFPR